MSSYDSNMHVFLHRFSCLHGTQSHVYAWMYHSYMYMRAHFAKLHLLWSIDFSSILFYKHISCMEKILIFYLFLPFSLHKNITRKCKKVYRQKSARFARTFSSRASRAARKNERAWDARPNGRRASRSDVYELRATRSVLRAS